MLVLSRRSSESVIVGGSGSFEHVLKVTVLEIGDGRVRLGFEVDADVPVYRLEVWERIIAEAQPGQSAARSSTPKEQLDRWEDDGAQSRPAIVPVGPGAAR